MGGQCLQKPRSTQSTTGRAGHPVRSLPAVDPQREINFVANLWFDVYHKFYQMDTLTFSAIEYQPAPVVV